MREGYIDLLTLQSQVREGLEDLFPDRIWVLAEISSISVKAGGHCYLDLSQDDGRGSVARARAIIWRNRYAVLSAMFREAVGEDLKAGMSVLFRVQVNYSELYGLSFIVDDLDIMAQVGAKEMERRRTIERLSSEGLMEKQGGLALCDLPYRLAIISAPTAAGLQDFEHHLHDNSYSFAFSTTLYDAVMQGEGAPASICDAFERIESSGIPYDAVLLLRGGGSASDLECFDSYDIAFSIANCPYPVFTAIGHDKDYHVADMVSYSFVKTPTALADVFLELYMSEDERIESYSRRLRMAFLSRIHAMETRVDLLYSRILSSDPRNILSRGYTLVADSSGRVVKAAAGVRRGDTIKVMFADGGLVCKVEAKDGKEV